jgi:hypothetical protein
LISFLAYVEQCFSNRIWRSILFQVFCHNLDSLNGFSHSYQNAELSVAVDENGITIRNVSSSMLFSVPVNAMLDFISF